MFFHPRSRKGKQHNQRKTSLPGRSRCGSSAGRFYFIRENVEVGLGHNAVVVHGAIVEAGRLDLGSAHAVADEQEDVLGFLEQAQQAVLLVGCGIRANVKSRTGM